MTPPDVPPEIEQVLREQIDEIAYLREEVRRLNATQQAMLDELYAARRLNLPAFWEKEWRPRDEVEKLLPLVSPVTLRTWCREKLIETHPTGPNTPPLVFVPDLLFQIKMLPDRPARKPFTKTN